MTAAFSHEGTTHILLNLFALYSIATPVMAMLGNVCPSCNLCQAVADFSHQFFPSLEDRVSCLIPFFRALSVLFFDFQSLTVPQPKGVMASTTSLLSSAFLVNRSANYGSHGASGAVLGCLSFFAACYPRATFLVFFVVPAPAWVS